MRYSLSKFYKRVLQNQVSKKIYDITISSIILLLFSPILLFIYIGCLIETGSPLYVQIRVGQDKRPFKLYKFRTMKRNTPSIASHLVNKNSVLKFGKIIRSLKLDELPQLINVLKGDMSLVGPRPCLFNQEELILEREKYNIFKVKPGITGLAQINGIDMSDPQKLAETDFFMISNLTKNNYFKYLFLTLFGKGKGDVIGKN